jgi:hypothetical protein
MKILICVYLVILNYDELSRKKTLIGTAFSKDTQAAQVRQSKFTPLVYLKGKPRETASCFDEWFFRTVYTQALVYGGSIKDILQNSTPAWKEQVGLEKTPERIKNASRKHPGTPRTSA